VASPCIGEGALDPLSKLILELYRTARETPVEEFQELALSLLKSQIPFRTAMWGEGEATDSGFMINSVHLHNEPLEILHGWASLHRHDRLTDELMAAPGQAKICHAPQTHHDAKDVLDFAQRYGHLNILAIADPARNFHNGYWQGGFIGLYRANKHAHFGQVDQRFLEDVMPHLAEALAINRLLGTGQVSGSGSTGARALARMDGTLYHCGKKFADILREIWPELKNGRLPAELMAELVPGKEVMLPGHNIAVTTTAVGSLLMLSIRRVSPLAKLTQRELMVARLFGQGESHKEIAQHLGISPATVRNFLSAAYRKLDINDKAELAALVREGHY